MGGRYDVWLENLIMPEMAVRTFFMSPAGANKSSTKLGFCKRLKLEQSPERVKSFFQDPRGKYAA
jgi:hypothetical protein